MNNLWRRTVRPGIIFAGAIALLSAGPHTYEAFAQGGSIPLRGGIQQPPQQRPDQETGTRLFKAPSGELFRVWTRRIDQVGSTVVLASSADGVTWHPLTQLQARDREANLQEAHLAINEAGDIALAYRWIGVQKIKHLRLARSIDAGKTWTVPTDNLDSTAGAFAPQVAWGTERTIVMAWPDEGATTSHRYDVYLRRSPDGGITWESPVVVTRYRQDGSSYKPHLSGDGRGRFWLAWIESRIGRRSALLLSRSEDNGRTWSPPQQVSGDTHSIVGQSLDLSSNGRLLLTWGAQRSEPVELPPRIYAASSADGGVTWSQPVEVDGLAAQASTIALGHSSGLTASGEAWVAWYDNRNGRDDVFVARSPDGGLTWGTPFRLDADSPGTAQSLFPRLAVSPDGTVVAVVWQDDRSGLEAVYARIFSGRQWSEETLIGAAIPLKKASRAPQIVPTGKEGFYVTWEVSDYSQGPNPQQTLDSIVVRIR